MTKQELARRVVTVAAQNLGAGPGDPVERVAVARAIGAREAESALNEAETRGWIKPLSGNYLEFTRSGYIAWLKRVH